MRSGQCKSMTSNISQLFFDVTMYRLCIVFIDVNNMHYNVIDVINVSLPERLFVALSSLDTTLFMRRLSSWLTTVSWVVLQSNP